MPKPELISNQDLRRLIQHPSFISHHQQARNRRGFGSVTEASIAEVMPGGAERSIGSFLSVSIDEENSRIQRLLYLPKSDQLANELENAEDLKAAVWAELKTMTENVFIGEWETQEDDSLSTTYSWPAAEVLRAYGIA